MCPTSTQPYIFKVEYQQVTTLKYTLCVHVPNFNPALHFQSGVSTGNNPKYTLLFTMCVHVPNFNPALHFQSGVSSQVTTLKYTLLFTMCVHVTNFNPALHFQSGVSSGSNPIHNTLLFSIMCIPCVGLFCDDAPL